MDLIETTHVVTRAGAAFGFCLMVVTGAVIFYSNGRTFKALKKRRFWLPWVASFLVMVLASAVVGGIVGNISGAFTGSGNKLGQEIGNAAVGQSGAGAVELSTGEVLGYSGSWIALTLIILLGLFIWFAKGWGERVLAISGALTGSTWGIASSLGGLASMIGVPLMTWVGQGLIG
ncbi:hypothetical protein ACFWP3_16950 [Streptomyces sp. NPDC058525]|uniref:hypothetical protein n=1 Tax=Streptomyces sp. NPDC058525 TaxID=3346538 RepID=UPI0036575FE6